jgi:hypothetical protein
MPLLFAIIAITRMGRALGFVVMARIATVLTGVGWRAL